MERDSSRPLHGSQAHGQAGAGARLGGLAFQRRQASRRDGLLRHGLNPKTDRRACDHSAPAKKSRVGWAKLFTLLYSHGHGARWIAHPTKVTALGRTGMTDAALVRPWYRTLTRT